MTSHSIIALSIWLIISCHQINTVKAFKTESDQNGASVIDQLVTGQKNTKNNNYERALEESNVEEDCRICGRLGVPLIPEALIDANITCNKYQDRIDELPARLARCQHIQEDLQMACCNFAPPTLPYYQCEDNIHSLIIDSSPEKASIPPRTSSYPVVVDTLIEIYAIENIDIKTSAAEMFVTIHLSWNDPRLAWNRTADNCVTSTVVRASLDPERTSIWVPDLDLTNRIHGLDSVPDTVATLFSDGTVTWIRQGKISAFCSFIGLRNIPYDTLGCEFIFGTPSQVTHTVYNLIETSNEASRGVRFPFYKQTYTEYTISEEHTTRKSIDGHTFTVELFFRRQATIFYVTLIVVPTILFVYVSFFQFFYEPSSGERVSFSINLLFVIVANSIVTSSFLPICRESLWLNTLTIGCLFVVLLCTFETLILNWIYVGRHQCNRQTENLKGSASPPNLDDGNNEGLPIDETSQDRERTSLFRNLFVHDVKKLRMKILKIADWVDSVLKVVIPMAFTIWLIAIFATEKKEEDKEKIWLSYNS